MSAQAVPQPDAKLDSTFLVVFATCCAAGLVPTWLGTYLPMVDLPQHAAQVATWHRWDDPAGFDYANFLWVNWSTPYLTSNTLAYLLSWVVPVSTAFQIVVSLAVVGVPLVTLALVQEVRGNPWWAILAIPAGYSYSYFMGFVAFALATPLALYFLLRAWRYAKTPSARDGWWLVGLLYLLFLTHSLMYGWAGLVGALVVAVHAKNLWSIALRWWPFALASILPGIWLVSTAVGEKTTDGFNIGGYHWTRPLEIPALLLGHPTVVPSLLIGCLFLALPFLCGGRASADFRRWLPFLVSLGLYLASPDRIFETSFLNQRFVALLLPTLLFALEFPAAVRPVKHWKSILATTVTVLWLAILSFRFLNFSHEVGSFRKLIFEMEPDRRVLYLGIDRSSRHVPYPVFMHFGSWYQVERGGLVDFSFSSFFLNRFRYRTEAMPKLPFNFEWKPRLFDWDRHGGERYDYFLIRSAADPGHLFASQNAPVRPLARADGGWWLYGSSDPGTDVPNH